MHGHIDKQHGFIVYVLTYSHTLAQNQKTHEEEQGKIPKHVEVFHTKSQQ